MKTKRILATISAIAILSMLPLAANAEGFGNINVNLNDVMVGQRMQEMSQKLNDGGASMSFKVKKHHHKKNSKDQKTAQMLSGDDQMTMNNRSDGAVF